MVKIFCFGDSITYGLGEKPCHGWVGRLKNYVESKEGFNFVYNLGISGKLISDMNKRFDIELDARISNKKNDNVLIIALGNNDTRWIGLASDNSPQTEIIKFESELNTLIEKVKKLDFPCVFVGLTPVDESKTTPFIKTAFQNSRIKEFHNKIKNACSKNDIDFVNIFDQFIDENYISYVGDGLHPNSNGYQRMYELIKDFLIKKDIIK